MYGDFYRRHYSSIGHFFPVFWPKWLQIRNSELNGNVLLELRMLGLNTGSLKYSHVQATIYFTSCNLNFIFFCFFFFRFFFSFSSSFFLLWPLKVTEMFFLDSIYSTAGGGVFFI